MSSQLKLASASATVRRPLLLLKVALTVWTVAMCSSALARTSTTTSLAVSSGGIGVSSVSAGSLVTLTATVESGTTAVKQGQVNFCDATATYCTDIHLLGTAQLNSEGKAEYYLRPGVGSYSYKAEFLGTPKGVVRYAGSVSTVATLNVTGQIPTATTIAQSGPAGNYTLTASVYGFTKSKSAEDPTGTISFLDTTTSNSVLATAALASSDGVPAWVNATNPAVGSLPGSVVTGDFNGDGNLDLAVGVSSVTNTVTILLGDGQGNFTPVTSSPITASGYPILVQDFNGDGIPDLLLSSIDDGTLTVLLGNGDGTFTEASGSPISTDYGSFPVVSTDFNQDGIPDLAVFAGYYMIVLLGKGDGTFTEVPVTSKTITGDGSDSMVVGDFNGDGIPDLASVKGETIFIFLGKGDGTFKRGATITASPISPSSTVNLTTGDFNGDGKLDLAVPIYGPSGSVAIFLGNGYGTFQEASGSPFPAGEWTNRIAVGDFNGDGLADLFVEAATSTTDIFIFLGNGDGTFVPTPTGSTRMPCCLETVLGDFNGDGVTDIAASDFYNGVADIFLTAARQSTATVKGVSVTNPQQVVASYPGDSSYTSSESTSISLFPADTVALTSSPNPSYLDQSVTFSVMVSGSGAATPTGSVMFVEGSIPLGEVTLVHGQASFITTFPIHGTYSIVAEYSGDQNYQGAYSKTLKQVVKKDVVAPTTTTLASSPNPSTYGEGVKFTAVVTPAPPDGETISFMKGKTVLGTGTLSGGSASFTTSTLPVGTSAITAVYGGDSDFRGSKSKAVKQVVEKAE